MTTTPTKDAKPDATKDAKPDSETFTVHFVATGLTVVTSGRGVGSGVVTEYGQQMEVTPALRKLNSDRNGLCLFDLTDDEDAQVRRWGRPMFRRGGWPEGVQRLEYGQPEWLAAYDAARKDVFATDDPAERRLRKAKLDEEWGPAPVTSKTLRTIKGDGGA